MKEFIDRNPVAIPGLDSFIENLTSFPQKEGSILPEVLGRPADCELEEKHLFRFCHPLALG